MTLKSWFTWRTLVLSYLAVARTGRAGVISLEGEPHQDHQHNDLHLHDHHASVASSFMHFHGPVEGPEFEVKVPYIIPHSSEHNHLVHGEGHESTEEAGSDHDFHHGYTLDYVAHPKYKFSYGVEDHHTGDFHGQKETRDGSSVTGEYSVMEPGGNLRIVTYRADKDGFHAVVHNSGKNDHAGGTYSSEAHYERQGHHHPHQEIHVQEQPHHEESHGGHGLQEYAAGYGTHEAYN
ncbi:histidine-rich glycoprotein-like [Venturia canescens]|uniref:histidine-rich glycoprotein-like n=1 Tax=Venturia canescens TaxID=32260 RepID=UPI001C9C4927|nr:histidine-rich glycoprotein-like [Venturia canescens]